MAKYLNLFAILSAAAVLGSATAPNSPSSVTDPAAYNPRDVYHRDVVIMGGGSSGVYSSMRLRDHGKSVLVIEKRDTLGGHAEAWVDPVSGTPIDIGVQAFANDVAKDYFARFGLVLKKPGAGAAVPTNKYVDFATGKVADFAEPRSTAFLAAVDKYLAHLHEFQALQDSFNMSYPVHPDLLLPFGEFVAKYDLGDLVPRVFQYNQGAVPLLNISMLYHFKYMNEDESNSFKQGFLSLDQNTVTELYRRAAEELGPDVLLESTVVAMDRSVSDEVRVAVQTPAGPKVVIAKKLLTTIPPLLSNLVSYDLSTKERRLFGEFFANGYYVGVLHNTGLDPSVTYVNHGGPGRPYGVPELPGIHTLYSIPLPGDRLVANVYYGSPDASLSDDEVKASIVADLQRYQRENGLPVTQPEWLKFSNHSPFNLMVPNGKIADGFYEELFSLQGCRNTFYNGAAWHTQDSSALWRFTEYYVLPIMLASL